MIKLTRKFFASLRGPTTRRAVAWGIFFGFGAGLVPGFNLTSLIFLLALLFLNCNGGIGGLSALIGKLLLFPLAPLLYYIGYAVTEHLGFKSIVRLTADTPILALLNWDVYAVVGALLLIFVVGIPLSLRISKRLLTIHNSLSKAGKSKKKYVHFLLWLLAGKNKKKQKNPHAWFNAKRSRMAAIALTLILAFSFFFMDHTLRAMLERSMSLANGAEVNIQRSNLSLLKGQLTLNDLQVTHPEQPTHNRFQLEQIQFDLSLPALLTKRFEIDLASSNHHDPGSKAPSGRNRLHKR